MEIEGIPDTINQEAFLEFLEKIGFEPYKQPLRKLEFVWTGLYAEFDVIGDNGIIQSTSGPDGQEIAVNKVFIPFS